MLLPLVQFAEKSAPPPGYDLKAVAFELVISSDGTRGDLRSLFIVEQPAKEGGKPRLTAPPAAVPWMTRSNNPPPLLACDNAGFVLGLAKEDPAAPASIVSRIVGTEEPEATNLHAAWSKRQNFVALLAAYGDAVDDPDVAIILQWYARGCPGIHESVESLSDALRARLVLDLIAIRVEGSKRLCDKIAAQDFWASRALSTKGSGRVAHCLVCGNEREIVDTFPLPITGRLVPGATVPNVSLVSANFPAAQRGATGLGLRSTPVCITCATRAVQAFNALASSREHRWGSSNAPTAVMWWESSSSPSPAIMAMSAEITTEQVAGLLKSVHKTNDRSPAASFEGRDLDRFYALTFSGNVSRLVVRSWLDLPLAEATRNVAHWFANTENLSHTPFRSVFDLAVSLGPIGRGTNPDSAPEGMIEALVRTALTGHAPPQALLPLALARARAESHLESSSDRLIVGHVLHRFHSRAGLIRLALNLTSLKESPLTSHLDPTRSEPAYLHGRLFALRERIQYHALGEVNASIHDRFFARASVNPVSVDAALNRLTEQHLSAMRRKTEKKGLSISLGNDFAQLREAAGDPPKQLGPSEQGIWMTGYYQQRAYRRAHSPADPMTPSEDQTGEE